MAIVTMDTVLQAVLATANKEQNQMYPPALYSSHFNLVTAALLDESVKLFPTAQSVVDVIRPFLKTALLPVRDNMVYFPADYRNLLGLSIYTNGTNGCCTEEQIGDLCKYKDDPLAVNPERLPAPGLAGGCKSVTVRLVDMDEFDWLSDHPYKGPTLQKPIAVILRGEGVRVCPQGISNVEIRYVRQPNTYKYGYKLNADDTYSVDAATTVESEWTYNALQYLVKGITTVFATYLKDGELREGNLELKRIGFF